MNHIRLHVASRFSTELVQHHADHGTHGLFHVLAGVAQIGDGLLKQRLGLGVGLLVESKATVQLARSTKQLTQPIDGRFQAGCRVLGCRLRGFGGCALRLGLSLGLGLGLGAALGGLHLLADDGLEIVALGLLAQ